ncbi:carboxylesterase/lipase family protein [Rathayibacter soli]|uniref:carboxylesterase/lipase family protein n=1 Tax=Rathayibacter soli TaxID=3144168 RepID=UPI0027E3F4F9|nr:carboxylesterase family protein [Glaciibacter superstes]
MDSSASGNEAFVEAQTLAGRVRGRWRGDCAVFLGIPFAEPPVGALRFAAPVPRASWDGVRDALEFGATAQRGGDAEPTLIPEPSIPGPSTLNVNVFTPSPGTDAALPVLVYIHGGGFFAGSPASPWYDGAAFARDGVITVVISYRLGIEGFGWIEGAPHNRGVLDWLLALEWVRDNVGFFGGDPGRVTVAGQSAGGGAVLTLLGMPSAHPLFRAVYSISGATADVAPERAKDFMKGIAASAGVEPTRAGFESVPELKLLELQKKTMEPKGKQLDMLRSFADDGLALGPVIDGELITRSTLDSIRAGVGAEIPLVLGATDDEFSIAFADAKKQLRWVPAGFMLGKVGLRGEPRRAYLAANTDVRKNGTAAVLGRYLSDKLFRTYILKIVDARADAPTWAYRFSWRSPVHNFAFHCLDVPFFFDCLDADRVVDVAGTNLPQSVANDVHVGAVGLVTTGDPGWPRYGKTAKVQVFDTPTGVVENGYASVIPLLCTALPWTSPNVASRAGQ